MKPVTVFLLKEEPFQSQEEIDFKKFNEKTIKKDIENANSKYIYFMKDYKELSNNFFEQLLKLCEENYDICFLNYTLDIDGKTVSTESLEAPEIQKKPYLGDYIWCYIWNREKLLELLNSEDKSPEKIKEMFHYINYVSKPLIQHKPRKKVIKNFFYNDEKEEIRRKNIVYMGTFCNGQFNGYITWLKNIGRCFGKDFKITILYDKIYEPTKKEFEKYFEVLERKENTNYICDRLITTYSTYYYPKNILVLEENYLFIHGNMTDYQNIRKYKFDNYTKYIGVSEISAKKAVGFFPTEHFDHIINPIKIDPSEVKPHLKLVSALRNDPIKKVERIHVISQILDEEQIPYTWNVFIDKPPYESRVYGGVIYRQSIQNPLGYIKDADYFVQLSDSEACSYSVLESLALNTKVLLTPLDCYQEMRIDESQGFFIPFEYFHPENKEKLRKIILKAYQEKEKEMHNQLTEDMYEGYKDIFKK